MCRYCPRRVRVCCYRPRRTPGYLTIDLHGGRGASKCGGWAAGKDSPGAGLDDGLDNHPHILRPNRSHLASPATPLHSDTPAVLLFSHDDPPYDQDEFDITRALVVRCVSIECGSHRRRRKPVRAGACLYTRCAGRPPRPFRRTHHPCAPVVHIPPAPMRVDIVSRGGSRPLTEPYLRPEQWHGDPRGNDDGPIPHGLLLTAVNL